MDGERRNLVRYENGVTYVRANPAAPFTTGEKARRFAMVATTVAIVAAVCLVVAGHGGKPAKASLAMKSVAYHGTTRLEGEEPAGEESSEGGLKMPEMPKVDIPKVDMPNVEVPDPEESKKAAADAWNKASGAAGKAISEAEEAVKDIAGDVIPEEFDVEHALGWHADIAVYIATAYTIYYIWLCNVWEKILPRLNFNINLAAEEKAKFERLNNKKAMIGTWGEPNDEGVPNDQDLLWFRCAEGEELLFGESQRVMPGLIDTIMCGCGGNVYAVAVTSHRIIIQHDKRCLFGSTVLTTNEESYFVKNVHKANLNTDGCLNLGICTLHSSEMLSGGFNWIALGWIIDLILEWKPDLMNAITDERLKGWINMVPDDVIYMFSSVLVLFGTFLFLALLFFLMCPQSLLTVEMVKQAGAKSYTLKFQYPVRQAYHMHDAIMQARFGKI